MTPENFVYWLRGILEDNETNKLEPKKFKKIKEKLAEITGDKSQLPKYASVSSVEPLNFWSPYYSYNSWSRNPLQPLYSTEKLKSDPPVPDYKQGESI